MKSQTNGRVARVTAGFSLGLEILSFAGKRLLAPADDPRRDFVGSVALCLIPWIYMGPVIIIRWIREGCKFPDDL